MDDQFLFTPRIIRSPWPVTPGCDIEGAFDAWYPEDYLRKIADQGYDAIWLHALLREVVPTKLFPLADTSKVEYLRHLVQRADKYGIKVFCYVLEPRGLRAEDPFWNTHPEIKGQPLVFKDIGPEIDGTYYALCSSTPEVKEYIEEGIYTLFKEVPGLGGIFCITASELHTHCYSHYPPRMKVYTDPNFEIWSKVDFVCPRCAGRTRSDVVAEVITLLNRGVKRAAPDAQVIAWTWSWFLIEKDPQKDLIAMLPKDIILMSDWERGARKKVCGKFYPLDEYSYSYPGPSPRFKRQLELARRHNLRMMAKLQIGATHEFASVPYLPLPYLLAKKLERLEQFGVDGYLGCWVNGGEISPMTRLAGLMSRKPQLPAAQAVKTVATEEFGPRHAPAVLRAWRIFSNAWQEYPFSIPFLYNGPINYATAYPLSLTIEKQPITGGYMPLPRDNQGRLLLGDNLESWTHPFDVPTIVNAFRAILKQWDQGVAILEKAMTKDPGNHRLKQEWNLARHIALSIRSTINVAEFYPLYRQYKQAESNQAKIDTLNKLIPLFEAEIENALADRPLVEFDNRLGFHSEARGPLFTIKDLDDKVSIMRDALASMRETISRSN